MRKRTRALSAALLGSALVAGLALSGPIAASAATNGEIYAISWSGTLGSVDPVTGDFTPIGEVGLEEGSFTGFDVDPLTGLAYGVTYNAICGVYGIDLVTGAATLINPITVEGEPVEDCTAFDIDDSGVARVAYDNASGSNLGTVDLASGVFTPISVETPRLSALATDPTTGTLYAVSYNDNTVYSVDTTGSGTPVGTITEVDDDVYAADFDRAGLVWGTDFDNLLSFSPSDWVATTIGPLSQGEEDFGGEALTVYFAFPPAPQLAATGDASAQVVAGAALVLLLGGAVALASARRRAAA